MITTIYSNSDLIITLNQISKEKMILTIIGDTTNLQYQKKLDDTLHLKINKITTIIECHNMELDIYVNSEIRKKITPVPRLRTF